MCERKSINKIIDKGGKMSANESIKYINKFMLLKASQLIDYINELFTGFDEAAPYVTDDDIQCIIKPWLTRNGLPSYEEVRICEILKEITESNYTRDELSDEEYLIMNWLFIFPLKFSIEQRETDKN